MRFVVPIIALVACTDPVSPTEPAATSRVVRREIPMYGQPKIDVLFVVDNSPRMAAHRATLAANARTFIAGLRTTLFGTPDLHLGVVTTDLGSRGAADSTAVVHGDCSENGDAGVMRAVGAIGHNYFTDVRRGDGIRELDYDGALDDALAATFDALPTGCSFPRPLEAMRRAVENPANSGFLRDEVYLAVIFLSASDDCSFTHETFLDGADAYRCVEQPEALVPVAELAAWIKGRKDDPTKIVVGAAFGPAAPFVVDAQQRLVQPSCTIDQRSAQPGVRLQAFLDQFPNRSSSTSLCQSDLGGAAILLGQLFRIDLAGDPCFEEVLADVDPIQPGPQYECASWLESAGDQRLLHQCTDHDSATCWRIHDDPMNCPIGPPQALHFANFLPTSEATLAVIECLVQ